MNHFVNNYLFSWNNIYRSYGMTFLGSTPRGNYTGLLWARPRLPSGRQGLRLMTVTTMYLLTATVVNRASSLAIYK